jgi:hypothetical protein|tara:strand:+ start:1237 stop:1851 length:615 start_codon:yes stop_codon:yes gene_type:complete
MSDVKLIHNDVNDSIALSITEHHKTVSNIDTPKFFVKNKMGADYVEYSYMREVADKHYPGWSWNIIKSEALGSEAYVVQGRLRWFDNGIWREGDAVAAHRVQTKRDGNGFVDIGNDIKAANTDAIKKAFNMYMNIADDVYRNRVEDLTLTEDEIESIMTSAEYIQDSETRDKIANSIKRGEILKTDYKKVMNYIEKIKKGEVNE